MFQTIYRQDYVTPVCRAEYIPFRDDTKIAPPPWDLMEVLPGIAPKVMKDRPKRFPVHVEPMPKCPMCHPRIRKFERISAHFEKVEPEPADFKFELGQKRKIAIKWPRTEYTDTIHKIGRKVMTGRLKQPLKRVFFGRKKTNFVF